MLCMQRNERFEAATGQLDRVLDFFPRVESKAIFLFAIDTGLLGIIALNFRWGDVEECNIMLPVIIALGLIVASLYCVYRCIFPNLNGASSSLAFFSVVAKKTENAYIEEFLQQSEDQQTHDVLNQVWCNSRILDHKFQSIKNAFTLTALSLIPWFLFLIASATVHGQLPILS